MEKRVKEKEPTRLESALNTMSYHISELMTLEAPAVLRVGLCGPTEFVYVEITIEERKNKRSGTVWDQTYIRLISGDGESPNWAGNRAGARKVLSHLYADIIKDIVINDTE